MRVSPELEADRLKMQRSTWKPSWIEHLGCFLEKAGQGTTLIRHLE